MPSFVNLGCGNRYHRDWTNIDVVARAEDVLVHDLKRGIPLDDESCDVVYHSCVLEHFSTDDVLPFLRECWRIMKPGGIIRVAVPDLERICELYLQKLHDAIADKPGAESDYNWMMLELYDQAVREKSGGRMAEYFKEEIRKNHDFVFARIGEEARELMEATRPRKATQPKQIGFLAKILAKGLRAVHHPGDSMARARNLICQFRTRTNERFLQLFMGEEPYALWTASRFRASGEIHKWMYDEYSLSRLLIQAGFQIPRRRSPGESDIQSWKSYNLECLSDGTIIKPDALFMEASKRSAEDIRTP